MYQHGMVRCIAINIIYSQCKLVSDLTNSFSIYGIEFNTW